MFLILWCSWRLSHHRWWSFPSSRIHSSAVWQTWTRELWTGIFCHHFLGHGSSKHQHLYQIIRCHILKTNLHNSLIKCNELGITPLVQRDWQNNNGRDESFPKLFSWCTTNRYKFNTQSNVLSHPECNAAWSYRNVLQLWYYQFTDYLTDLLWHITKNHT